MSTAEHENVTKLDTQNLEALVELQRSKFRAEGEVTYSTRIDRLKRLKALIVENKKEFAETTKREFGGARSYEFSLFSEFASKVIAVNDLGGAIINPNGINIPELFKHTAKNHSVAGFDGADKLSQDILELKCDVLIPAAIGGVITTSNVNNIKAHVIVEAANSPTTVSADKILRDNKVLLIPDILANAGGVTASYFEWVQNRQNYLWKEKDLHEKFIDIMTSAFEEVWTISQKNNCDLRTAALIKGIKRVAAAKLTRGLFP